MPIFSKQPQKWQSLLLLLAGSITLSLLLVGFSIIFNRERGEQTMKNQLDTPSVSVSLTQLHFHSDTFLDSIDMSLVVESHNQSASNQTLYLGFSIVSPTNEVIDFPAKPFSFNSEPDQALTLSYSLKELGLDSILTGPYKAIIAIWDKAPITDTSTPLDRIDVDDAFRLYNSIDYFETIDTDLWYSRNGQLGRTQLKHEHVGIINDKLTISHPAGTLEGGEIQTIALKHYGSYETSMKLPDAPSSITGFFLYSAPDFYHEIDIEVFNQQDSEVWLTSYLDGSIHHEDKIPLAFDPTADYHQYRIDYYPDRVSFYIDGKPVKTWEDGFSHNPMHLMINSWFPTWLPGVKPQEDKELLIEWIAY